MNCRLSGLGVLFAAITVPTSGAEDAFPLKKEAVHALIREVAAKIEDRFKGIHPEADGLVQRVEETLAAPEPSTSDDEDRQSRLAKKLTLMNGEAGFKAMIGGVRGAVFDNSDTGFMQRYQDLESARTKDGRYPRRTCGLETRSSPGRKRVPGARRHAAVIPQNSRMNEAP